MPLFHSFERYTSIKLIIYAALPLLIFIFFFNYKVEDSSNNYSPFHIEVLHSSTYISKEKEEYFSIKDTDFIKFRKLIFKKYGNYSDEFSFSNNKNESSDNLRELSHHKKYNLKIINYEKSFEDIVHFDKKSLYLRDYDDFVTYKNFDSKNIKKKNEIVKKNDKILYIKNKLNNLKKRISYKSILNAHNENNKIVDNDFDKYNKKNYKTNSVWSIIEERALELDKYYNLHTTNNLYSKEIPKIIFKIKFYLSNDHKNGNNIVPEVSDNDRGENGNSNANKERDEKKKILKKNRKSILLLRNTFLKIYLNKNRVIDNSVNYNILKRIKKKNEKSNEWLEKNLNNKRFIHIFKSYRNLQHFFHRDYKKKTNCKKSNEDKESTNFYKNIFSENRRNFEILKEQYEDENITEEEVNNVKNIISKIELNVIDSPSTSLNLLNNESFQIDIMYDTRNNSIILLILYNKLKNNNNSSCNTYKSKLYIYNRSLNKFVENIISNSHLRKKIEQSYKKEFDNNGLIILKNEISELKKKISKHYQHSVLKLRKNLEGLKEYHNIYFNENKKENGLKKDKISKVNNKRKYTEKMNEKDNNNNSMKNTFKEEKAFKNNNQEKNNYYERKYKDYVKNNRDIHFFLKDNINDKSNIINYLCNNNKNNDFFNFSNYIFNYCKTNVCRNPFYETNLYVQKKFSKREICNMLIYKYYDIVFTDKNIKLYEFLNNKRMLFYKIYSLIEDKEMNNRNKKSESVKYISFYILKYLFSIINLSYHAYFFILNDIFQCYFLFIKYSFYYFFNKKKFLSMFNDLENFHPCISFDIIKNLRFNYFLNKNSNKNENLKKKKKEHSYFMKNNLYLDDSILYDLREPSDNKLFSDYINFPFECLCKKEGEFNLSSYKNIVCKIIVILRYILIYVVISYKTLVNILKKLGNNVMIIFNYLLFCGKNKCTNKNNLLFNYIESQIISSYNGRGGNIEYIKSNNVCSIFFLYYLLIYKKMSYDYNIDTHIYSDYFTILLKYLKKENKNEKIEKNKEICELEEHFLNKNKTCNQINTYKKSKKRIKKENHVKYINHYINSNGWKHITTIDLNSISSQIIINKETFDFLIKYKAYIKEEIVNRLIYFPLMNANKLQLFKDKIISIDENNIFIKYKNSYKQAHKRILNIYKKIIKDRKELKKQINNSTLDKNIKIYYYNSNKVLCFYYSNNKFLKKKNYVNNINNYNYLKKKKKNRLLLFFNRIKSLKRKNTSLNMLSMLFFNKVKCLKNKKMLKRNNSYFKELIKKQKKSIYYFDEYLFYFFFYFSKHYFISINKKKHNYIQVNKNNVFSSIKNKMEMIKYMYHCIFIDLKDYEEKLNILKTVKYITTTKTMIQYIEENKNLLLDNKYVLTHPFIHIFIKFFINTLKELDELLSFNCEKKNLENYMIYMNFIDLKIGQLYFYRQNLYNLKIFDIKQIEFHKFILNYSEAKKKMKKKFYKNEKYIKTYNNLERDTIQNCQKKNNIQYRMKRKKEKIPNEINFYEKELMLDYFDFSFFSKKDYEINNELFKNAYAIFINKKAEERKKYKFYLKNRGNCSIRNIENYKDIILNYEKILEEKIKNLYRYKRNLSTKVDLPFLIKRKQMKKYKKYENDLKILKKEIFLIDSLNELDNSEKHLFKNYLKENLFYIYELPYISEISLLKLTNKRIYFSNKNDSTYIFYGSVELSKLISNYEKYKYIDKKIPQLPIDISIPNYNISKKMQNKNLKFLLIKEVNNSKEEQIITISMYKYNNILRYYFNIYNIYNTINLTNVKLDFLLSQFQKKLNHKTNSRNTQHNSDEKHNKGKWNYNIYKFQKNNNKNENYLVFYKNKISEKRINYSLKIRCIQKIALPTNTLKYSINLHEIISNINNTSSKKKTYDLNKQRITFSIFSSLTNYYFSSFFQRINYENNLYEFSKKFFKNYNFTDLSDLQDFINNLNENTSKKWIRSDGNIIAFLKNSNLFLSIKHPETNKMSKPYYVSLDKLPKLYKSLRLIHVSFFSVENYFPFLNVINQKNFNNFHKRLIFLLLTFENGILALIAVYDDSDNLFSYFSKKFRSFFKNTHFFFLHIFIYLSLYILEILRCNLIESEGNQFAQIYVALFMLIDTILYPIFFFLYAIFNFIRKIFHNRINNTNVINNIDNDNIQAPTNR